MFTRIFSIGTLCLASCLFTFTGSARADDSMSKGDMKFAKEAALGGMTEVSASQLAVDKAVDPDVKAFGQHMIDDHSKANDELKALAQKKSMSIPMALDSSHQKTIDKLTSQTGTDFDKAYVKQMVSDHKDTVALFEKESQKGDDPDLKMWAAKTLPTLQAHLSMIEDIQQKMK
jgi:putative membrane protein